MIHTPLGVSSQCASLDRSRREPRLPHCHHAASLWKASGSSSQPALVFTTLPSWPPSSGPMLPTVCGAGILSLLVIMTRGGPQRDPPGVLSPFLAKDIDPAPLALPSPPPRRCSCFCGGSCSAAGLFGRGGGGRGAGRCLEHVAVTVPNSLLTGVAFATSFSLSESLLAASVTPGKARQLSCAQAAWRH